MKQIFLAPRANETSHNNFESSIIAGHPYSFFEPYLNDEERKILSNKETLRVWGTKDSLKSRWAKMNPGDYVLFYKEGLFYYSAIITHTKYNPELAEALWGKDKETGDTWNCLFFIDNLTPIEIPISAVREIADYDSSWDRVMGFMPLRESGIRAIEIKFGSVENFLKQDPGVLNLVENILEDNKDEVLEIEDSEVKQDKDELLKKAESYKNNLESFKISESPHKVRIENRKQKKIIAELEEFSCQLCGWKLEWINSRGKTTFRIDVDHIIEKKDGGTEESSNLWALCPNCHTKKTVGVIKINKETRKITENGKEIKLLHDHHLKW